jgi:uncharacterized membrane protein YkoI
VTNMTKRRTVLLLAVLAVILIPGAAAVTHAQQLAPATNSSGANPSPAVTGHDDCHDDCGDTTANCTDDCGNATAAALAANPSPATTPTPANSDDCDDDCDDDCGDTTANCTDDCGNAAIVGSIAVGSPAPSDLSALARLTPEAATAAALAAYPTATLHEIHLTVRNGYLVYEVEFVKGGEVLIDAGDGKVLRAETADSHVNNGSSGPAKDEDSCDDDSDESDSEQEDSGD